MTIHLTLVHGTFAANAPWTQEGSLLRRTLTNKLDDDVTFEVFPWSGENSFAARADAAEKLRALLDQAVESSPNDRHVVIAHSHGGNIALCAIEAETTGRQIDGVVCLATPFITARPRNFGEHSNIVLGLAKMVACGCLGIILAMAVIIVLAFLGIGLGPESHWGVIIVLPMATGGFGAWWAISKIEKAWVGHALRWADKVSVSVPHKPTRLLVIRAAADEALESLCVGRFPSILLTKGWQAVSWLAVTPLLLALRFDHWAVARYYRRAMLVLGQWCIVAAWIYWELHDEPMLVKIFLMLFFAVYFLVGTISTQRAGLVELIGLVLLPFILLLGGAFVCLLLVLSLFVVPFNTSFRGSLDFARTAVWLGPVDVSAEPVPPRGLVETRQLPDAAEKGLQHSMPYQNPESLQWIVEWLSPGTNAQRNDR